MYRLVVVLMIVSLSGSEASGGSKPEWDIFGERYQNLNFESLTWNESPLNAADALLQIKRANMKPEDFNEFEVAEELAEEIMQSAPPPEDTDEIDDLEKEEKEISLHAHWMRQIFLKFAQLESIDKDIKSDHIICSLDGIYKLKEFQIYLESGVYGNFDGIPTNLDSYLFKRVLGISEKFFSHCMPKLKEEFEKLLNDPELEDAFEQMGVFDIFIDAEEVAQRPELPRYCNRKNQIIDLKTYWSLVQKIGAQAGKEPAIWEGNIGLYEPVERRKMMSEFFSRTCKQIKFDPVEGAVGFIMVAKGSLKFNREWNSMFDCGEKMGRFQLCLEAWKTLEKF